MNTAVIALGVAVVALCFTILNATVGIFNFVLNRCRLLKIVSIDSSFGEDKSGTYHRLQVDLLSYGASIWDLQVQLKIFVQPTAQTIVDGTVGTASWEFIPTKEFPNPLNAGKGARLTLTWRDAQKDRIEDWQKRFKAARLRHVCIEITGSEGRKVLKRIGNKATLRKINIFLGSPRNIGWGIWNRTVKNWVFRLDMWRNRRLERKARGLAAKKGIPFRH